MRNLKLKIYFNFKIISGNAMQYKEIQKHLIRNAFIKAAVLKNVWKIHKKSPVQRFFFRASG